MQRQIIISEDGSHTIYIPELNEHYHSVHGAMQESQHVFIKSGLHFLISKKSSINILEVGFGTGLNAFLTFIEAQKFNIEISYTTIEAYPVEEDIYSKLNYHTLAGDLHTDLFFKIHTAKWNEEVEVCNKCSLLKINGKIEDFNTNKRFDLVYFDAFAPDVQAELWTEQIFKKIYGLMNEDSVLTTYCTKGIVKQNLRNAGFKVKRLAGPPGKMEITRAYKD